MKVLLGITGSVAGELTPKLYNMLVKDGHEVKVVITERGKYFLSTEFLIATPAREFVTWYDDKQEFPYSKYDKDDRIPHIELRDWADVFLVCPCSANTMAKFATGICDNLLTSVFRAWDFNKPVYLAPAMNTNMWTHPVTATHLKILKQWNVKVIYPTVKKLACGQYGVGGLAHLKTIVNIMSGHRWRIPFAPADRGGLYLPLPNHPGAFGTPRHLHCHTGVDLYRDQYATVTPCEPGTIVDLGQFTGDAVGSPHWEDTWYVSVEGKSGTICYGEIDPNKTLKVGDEVDTGACLGVVLRVLKKLPKRYVEGHKPNMLHIELMKSTSEKKYALDWDIGENAPSDLLDPTPYLYLMENEV